MKRLDAMVAVPIAALSLISLPAQADQLKEITMLVESFDGCGCMGEFEDPISCAACPAGISHTHPDCDFWGPESLDHQWKNNGWPSDMFGDNTIRMQGYASQGFSIGDLGASIGCPNLSSAPITKWEHIRIDYDNAACTDCPNCTTGATRFDFNTARIAQSLPAAAWDGAGYFLISVRRDDANSGSSDFTTKIWVSISGAYGFDENGNEVLISSPTSLPAISILPVAPDTPPAQGWQDIRVVNATRFIKKAKITVLVDLGPEDGSFVDCSQGERVTVRVDNLRYVYTGLVPDAETNCADGLDEDQDGLTDCDDIADCNGNAACACNQIVLFDTDFDGDVDQADFAFFQACVTGPGPENPLFEGLSARCKCLDHTGAGDQADQAIDQSDLLAFENCASGPGVAADTGCDD